MQVARRDQLLNFALRIREVCLGLEALDDQRVFVVEASCDFLALHRAYVLFDFTSDDHDLPLCSIFGDSSVAGATIATGLQEEGLVLTLDQDAVRVFNLLEQQHQVLLRLIDFRVLPIHRLAILRGQTDQTAEGAGSVTVGRIYF